MISNLLAGLIFTIMSIVALIHIYWAFGGFWPGNNQQDLIDKVVGIGDKFPSWPLTFFVIFAFVAMAILPILYLLNPGNSYLEKLNLFFASIFLLRGVVCLIPFFEKTRTEIFTRYNRRFYSPLCLILSLAQFSLYYSFNLA